MSTGVLLPPLDCGDVYTGDCGHEHLVSLDRDGDRWQLRLVSVRTLSTVGPNRTLPLDYVLPTLTVLLDRECGREHQDLQWQAPMSTPVISPQPCVYFIRSGTCGPVKIGTALDVESRRRTLQTGNPERLTVIRTEPGDATRERELHERFASCRIAGEWFAPTADLLAYISGGAA